mgnify:CR=1 FL=1
MFNVYTFEKKIKQDEDSKVEEDKHKRVMSTHRKMRDVLSENYQKRVASFIREMVDSPVQQSDDYTMRLTLNTSKASEANKSQFTSFNAEGKQLSVLKRNSKNRYCHNQAKSLSMSTQEPTKDFRYASFRTEKERIEATIQANQQF